MKIRPEARNIMVAFGSLTTEPNIPTEEEISNLIDSLGALDSATWQPLPLTALAQAQAYARANSQTISATPNSGALDAIVNYLSDTPPAPIAPEWRAPLLSAVDEASESYFTAAHNDFNRGDIISGVENLCHAANCVVIGQAAIHGWPHATDDDDINAVVALATGKMPQNADEIYNLLQQASSDGLDLSSNHGAAKSLRQAARLGYFVEHGYTAELATSFAQEAAKLAKQLGADTP